MNPPHIAKRRDYPPFVTLVEAHTSTDMRYRDILRLNCGWQPGVNHRRLGIFIGANPSAANGAGSDLTINKVLRTFCGEFACNDVYILNLSPLRATLAAEAVATLNDPEAVTESIERNPAAMTLLHEAIKEGVFLPVIWVGWGDCLKRHTSALARPFKELLEGREVLHLPLLKNGEPGHPCRADLKTLRRSVLWPKPAKAAPCDHVYTDEDILF